MTKNILQIPCQKIISGGQTGVDRGALDSCLKNIFPCGGWCPKGRIAEDGFIIERYPLSEMNDITYSSRTRQNVIDSDATLIISTEKLIGGTLLTQKVATELKKPLFILKRASNGDNIVDWLFENNIEILNVAGPRASEWSIGYKISFDTVSNIVNEIKNRSSKYWLNG